MFGFIKPATLRPADGWIALVCGTVFAVLSAWIIAPQIMFTENLSPFISPNFGEYCEILGLWDSTNDRLSIQPLRRSMAASIPTYIFIDALGVIDGLGAGALLCALIIGTSIYIWTAALGGRFAGCMAVTAALATGILPLLTRHFTFYPAIVACFVLAAALCTWASRSQDSARPIAILLASSVVGACLLSDVRGLIWAAPMLLLLTLLSMGASGWKRRLLCGVFLCLPIWGSHQLGEWNSGGMQIVSLEEQVDVRPLAYLHGARGPQLEPPFQYPSQFFWGVSDLAELPKTVQFLLGQISNQDVAELEQVRGLETVLFESKVDPWEKGALVSAFIVLLGMWRDPKGLMALVLTGAPFAAAQMGIHAHHEVRIRFLFQTMPLLSVLYGLAASHCLTWLLQAVAHTSNTARAIHARNNPHKSILWPTMGGFIVILCTVNISGWIPGPLHMNAGWRGGTWHFVNGHITLYKMMVEDGMDDDVLGTDPWSNNGGVSSRWVFREKTCDPLLTVDRARKGDAFVSGFYDELPPSLERQVKPAVGFAPNMSFQRPR